MPDFSSEKTIGMRLALPASWQKKLKMLAAASGESKAGARTEVMKAIAAWIKEDYPSKTLSASKGSIPTGVGEKKSEIKHAPYLARPSQNHR